MKGVDISTRAHAFDSKRDQRVQVVISVELSCGNEIVTWSRYIDPQEGEEVKMEGRTVVEFPAPERRCTITLRVERTKTLNGRLTVTEADILENSVASVFSLLHMFSNCPNLNRKIIHSDIKHQCLTKSRISFLTKRDTLSYQPRSLLITSILLKPLARYASI